MPSFGLTFLSRSALREAEQLMLGETAGVRDEVGFLIVHQRYADRFFPGTSVLHTRLRYSLFIPWILERLKARGAGGATFTDALRREETALAERLKGEKYGVIGRLTLPEASSQPPSYAYWTALSTWGLVDLKPSGRVWSRVELGALAAASRGRTLKDDDGRPLAEAVWPVAELPPTPDGWDSDAPLGFGLLPREKHHLAKLLRAVRCPTTDTPSLLARLVGHSISDAGSCWEQAILDLAGEHRPALLRAGRAASLAAIGRGAYAALVEIQKECDGRAAGHRHRDALAEVLTRHADWASGLDPDDLVADLQPDLPSRVEEVLRRTLAWIRGGGTQVSDLLEAYRRAEIQRKGPRARLAEEQRGVDRRIEWDAAKHPSPEPLHYRWDRVRLMMRDLEAA
ncbi:DUF6361 family protein [Methylobacterium indicum]|uniref:Uncharacterized protein n=1 Tax=Methylobacterium indicum TaxID=1775910 RepID=A0A8H8WYU8_9HYPH|nr:DUF6361 family protein [Methylobacterium indicum]BCM86713.1 hypothetical protein mvi_51740 [Methylobacterium indicum]